MTTTTGTIEQVDPQTLTIAVNVRTDAALGKEFVDSVRANGVLVPVVATRADDGTLHVRYGQRRTRAAQEAGTATIPVYVVDVDEADTAQRIVEQLVENDQREALTETERLDAWRQLELEGLSATQIAKRTGTKRDRIKTGLTVAASETGTALIGQVGLTLDQAAALLEFEDDAQTIADLTEVATEQPDYFPVAVQQARNDRAAATLREKIEQQEAAKGHRILDRRPDWDEPTPYRLHQVTTVDGDRVTSDDVADRAGMAAHVDAYDAERHQVTYYVDDVEAAGLALRPGEEGPARGPMSDEQKAERKTLIANNKEWDAAETVRREWLATFLTRKTLPKDAATIIATAIGGEPRRTFVDGVNHGNTLAKTLLGLPDEYGTHPADYLTKHPTRPLYVALAVTLGGIETTTDRNTWRNPHPATAWYLQTLAAWGYSLSPVERIAAMLPTED